MEAALEGQAVGFATTIDLAVEDAFGARDESLVRTIPKSEFPPGVKVGGQLQGVGNDGQPQVFNVVKIKGPRGAPRRQPPAGRPSAAFSCKVTDACRPAEKRAPPCACAHGHHH